MDVHGCVVGDIPPHAEVVRAVLGVQVRRVGWVGLLVDGATRVLVERRGRVLHVVVRTVDVDGEGAVGRPGDLVLVLVGAEVRAGDIHRVRHVPVATGRTALGRAGRLGGRGSRDRQAGGERNGRGCNCKLFHGQSNLSAKTTERSLSGQYIIAYSYIFAITKKGNGRVSLRGRFRLGEVQGLALLAAATAIAAVAGVQVAARATATAATLADIVVCAM